MSVENLKKFGKMCADKEDVRNKAKEIGIKDPDGLIAYGKELGLEFSKEDMETLGKEAQASEELSEEQLEAVAGGFMTTTAVGIGLAAGAVLGAGLAIGAAVGGAQGKW